MISWKPVEPDFTPRDLGEIIGSLSFLDAVLLARELSRHAMVLFLDEAREGIMRHVGARREESGGLLLGIAATPRRLSGISKPLVCVTDVVPALEYEGTSISLRMDHSVWTSASLGIERGLMVVGWFHSHPNLGAFFSGTDRATQRQFFAHDYSLGYVVDPVRDDHAYFMGPECEEIDHRDVITLPSLSDLPATLR